MVLGFSRHLFARFVPGQGLDEVVRGHLVVVTVRRRPGETADWPKGVGRVRGRRSTLSQHHSMYRTGISVRIGCNRMFLASTDEQRRTVPNLAKAVICVALTIGAASCGETRNEDLLRAFDEIVFAAGLGTERPARVYKWRKPISITVKGQERERYITELERAVRDVKRVTAMNIVIAEDQHIANVILYFDDGEGYLAHLDGLGAGVDEALRTGIANGYCWSNTWTVGYDFDHAVVFVSGDGSKSRPDARLRACLYHELAHVLGLSYHPTEAFSVLDNNAAEFTRSDAILLGLLYDRRITAGMTRDETLRVAREILLRRKLNR